MYHSIEEFLQEWAHEETLTLKVLEALTDESLSHKMPVEYRTIGELAWHIVTSVHEMVSRTGLNFEGAAHDSAQPETAKEFVEAYRTSSNNLVLAMKEQWTDETLNEEDDMYGQMWPRKLTLSVLNSHQIHHRGQLTVLMRLAGLRVPGMYGPSREEWAEAGM